MANVATLTAKMAFDASGFMSTSKRVIGELQSLQKWAGLAGISTSTLTTAFTVGGAAGVGFAGAMAGVKTALAGVQAIAGAVAGEMQHGMGLAMAAESAQSQFKVLLGSLEKAKGLMKDLQSFTLQTPFTMEGSLGAAKVLMGTGVPQERMMSTMRMLGEIAGGNTETFNGLAVVYGQVMSKGKLLAQDFNQIAERGINMRDVLAKELKIKVKDLADTMQEGKITATDFHNALHALATGKYQGSLEESTKTLQGAMDRLSEIRDTFSRDVMTGVGKNWGLTATANDLANFAEGLQAKVVPDVVSAFDMMGNAVFDFADNLRAVARLSPQVGENVGTWLGRISAKDVFSPAGTFGGIHDINTKRDVLDYLRSIRQAGAETSANRTPLAESARMDTPGAVNNAGRQAFFDALGGSVFKNVKPLGGGFADFLAMAKAMNKVPSGMLGKHPLEFARHMMEIERNNGGNVSPVSLARGRNMLRSLFGVGSDVGRAFGDVGDRFRIRGETPRERKPTGALVAGSSEAFSAIIRAMFGQEKRKEELETLKSIKGAVEKAGTETVQAIKNQITGILGMVPG